VVQIPGTPNSPTDLNLPNSEAVNHPAHYGGKDNPYEAIKVIEAWELGFNTGNAVKYVSRCGRKTVSRMKDLQKAAWYLLREVSIAEGFPPDHYNDAVDAARNG
jgi:hypothetical protein